MRADDSERGTGEEFLDGSIHGQGDPQEDAGEWSLSAEVGDDATSSTSSSDSSSSETRYTDESGTGVRCPPDTDDDKGTGVRCP